MTDVSEAGNRLPSGAVPASHSSNDHLLRVERLLREHKEVPTPLVMALTSELRAYRLSAAGRYSEFAVSATDDGKEVWVEFKGDEYDDPCQEALYRAELMSRYTDLEAPPVLLSREHIVTDWTLWDPTV